MLRSWNVIDLFYCFYCNLIVFIHVSIFSLYVTLGISDISYLLLLLPTGKSGLCLFSKIKISIYQIAFNSVKRFSRENVIDRQSYFLIDIVLVWTWKYRFFADCVVFLIIVMYNLYMIYNFLILFTKYNRWLRYVTITSQVN